jgi:hypothetical protein
MTPMPMDATPGPIKPQRDRKASFDVHQHAVPDEETPVVRITETNGTAAKRTDDKSDDEGAGASTGASIVESSVLVSSVSASERAETPTRSEEPGGRRCGENAKTMLRPIEEVELEMMKRVFRKLMAGKVKPHAIEKFLLEQTGNTSTGGAATSGSTSSASMSAASGATTAAIGIATSNANEGGMATSGISVEVESDQRKQKSAKLIDSLREVTEKFLYKETGSTSSSTGRITIAKGAIGTAMSNANEGGMATSGISVQVESDEGKSNSAIRTLVDSLREVTEKFLYKERGSSANMGASGGANLGAIGTATSNANERGMETNVISVARKSDEGKSKSEKLVDSLREVAGVRARVLSKGVDELAKRKHESAVALRRCYYEHAFPAVVGADLMDNIPFANYDFQQVYGRNCENPIGYVPVPLTLLGPIQVNGSECFMPMATTEGALAASVSRGIKALNLCGGVTAIATERGMTRSPVFHATNNPQIFNDK